MTRTGTARIHAIPATIAAAEAFRSRVADAAGDAERLADLMAEAIEMARQARGIEPAGRDGRSTVCMEEFQAALCLDAARATYLAARRG